MLDFEAGKNRLSAKTKCEVGKTPERGVFSAWLVVFSGFSEVFLWWFPVCSAVLERKNTCQLIFNLCWQTENISRLIFNFYKRVWCGQKQGKSGRGATMLLPVLLRAQHDGKLEIFHVLCGFPWFHAKLFRTLLILGLSLCLENAFYSNGYFFRCNCVERGCAEEKQLG